MSKTGKGLAEFAAAKVGTPYVYGAKGANGKLTQVQFNNLVASYVSIFTSSYVIKAKKYVGQVCTDCSGLISWYTGKVLGSAQLYSKATKRGLIADIASAPVGAILWKSGHVGVKIDNTYCIEAKGIAYGTIKSKISATKWTHWLLFEDIMSYDEVTVATTKKAANPYTKPMTTVKKGGKGATVKWVQWELVEAGYKLDIDGDFGSITDKYVRKFQQSSKLTVDGKVGPKTIAAFVAD